MFRKALALLAWGLVINGPANAQSPTVPPDEILGTWVWDVQGRNLAVLNLEAEAPPKGLYDENLIPDSLRQALGVPTRAEEAAMRAAMEAASK